MCRVCDWESYVDKIEGMISDGEYKWAEDTLSGILEWVEENGHITDKQMRAVDNIESRGN